LGAEFIDAGVNTRLGQSAPASALESPALGSERSTALRRMSSVDGSAAPESFLELFRLSCLPLDR
jgi:hypothetical protein